MHAMPVTTWQVYTVLENQINCQDLLVCCDNNSHLLAVSEKQTPSRLLKRLTYHLRQAMSLSLHLQLSVE